MRIRRRLQTPKGGENALGGRPFRREPAVLSRRLVGGASRKRNSPPRPSTWSPPVSSKRRHAGTDEAHVDAAGHDLPDGATSRARFRGGGHPPASLHGGKMGVADRGPLYNAMLQARPRGGGHPPASPRGGEAATPSPNGKTSALPVRIGARAVCLARGVGRRGAGTVRRESRRRLGRAARRTTAAKGMAHERHQERGVLVSRHVHPIMSIPGTKTERATTAERRAGASQDMGESPQSPLENLAAMAVILQRWSGRHRSGRARRKQIAMHRRALRAMQAPLPVVTPRGQQTWGGQVGTLHKSLETRNLAVAHMSGQLRSPSQRWGPPPTVPEARGSCLP